MLTGEFFGADAEFCRPTAQFGVRPAKLDVPTALLSVPDEVLSVSPAELSGSTALLGVQIELLDVSIALLSVRPHELCVRPAELLESMDELDVSIVLFAMLDAELVVSNLLKLGFCGKTGVFNKNCPREYFFGLRRQSGNGAGAFVRAMAGGKSVCRSARKSGVALRLPPQSKTRRGNSGGTGVAADQSPLGLASL